LSGVAVTTFSAGTTGFTPSSATSGAITLAGTLATTNGGTGLTSFTANGVVYASSTSALATGSALQFNGTNLGIGGNPLSTGIDTGSTNLFSVAPNSNFGAALTTVADSVGRNYAYSDATKTYKGFLDIGSAGINFGSSSSIPVNFYTSGSTRMILDASGNLGLGVAPSAWSSSFGVIQGYSGWSISGDGTNSNSVDFLSNAYRSGSNTYTYLANSSATRYQQKAGAHVWYNAPSTTGTVTWNQAMTLTVAGTLVVGDTTGNGKLSVRDSSAALQEIYTTAGTNYAALQIMNNSGGIYVGKDNSAGSFFGTNTAYASCLYSYGAFPLVFFTNAAERMRLTSTGNLDLATAGAVFTTNRGAYNQQTKFYTDSATGSGAQYETTNPSVNANYYPHIFKGTNNVPTTVEYGRFNQFGLGLGGASPTSGTGITFPATQSASSDANTLDDYEEGTFAATFLSDGGSVTTSATIRYGFYTKIGRQVTVCCNVQASAVSSPTGDVYIQGLPFAASSATGYVASAAVAGYGFKVTAVEQLNGQIGASLSLITLNRYNAGSQYTISGDIQATSSVVVTATYFTS
jgi:hypothetical protein